jgi:hypothetical protein
MFVPHRKHTYSLPRLPTGVALHFTRGVVDADVSKKKIVITAVILKDAFFSEGAPCFAATYRIHLQDRRLKPGSQPT